jgi:glycosyltransferase involved in cell wall biosynthesis
VTKVSIVIPTYNAAAYLPEAIESALAQSYDDCEIIVVDDGSDDDTEVVLAPFKDRFRYIRQENSGGASRPRNVGIQQSAGDYVAFLDSDDILFPDKIRHAVELLDDQPSVGMVFTDFVVAGEDGRWHRIHLQDGYDTFRGLDKCELGESRFLIRGEVAFDGLLLENFIGTSSVVCRREVFSRVGLFDEALPAVEDRDMWLKIASCYDIGYLDRVDHVYRVREDSISRRGAAVSRARIEVFRRHIGDARSRETRRQTTRKIARSYSNLAYSYRLSGDFAKARRYYLDSLREAILVESVLGLVKTSLGQRALRLIKRAMGHPEGRSEQVAPGGQEKLGAAAARQPAIREEIQRTPREPGL